MNAADVVGYTFDADTYCVDCTERAYPGSTDWRREGFDPADYTDSEGNEIHPIFGGGVHSGDSPDYCGACHELLAPYECSICGDEHGESAHGDPLVMRDQSARTIVDAVAVYVLDAMSITQDGKNDAEFQRLASLYDDWNAQDGIGDHHDEYAPEYLDDIDAILSDAGYHAITDGYQGTWSVYAPVPSPVTV